MTSIDRRGSETQHDHPRPTSAFLPLDGRPANVAEALCLVMSALLDHVHLDVESNGPPTGDGRRVTGADVVVGVRDMLSSSTNRSLLIGTMLPGVMPALRRALMNAGYANHMMKIDEAKRQGQ